MVAQLLCTCSSHSFLPSQKWHVDLEGIGINSQKSFTQQRSEKEPVTILRILLCLHRTFWSSVCLHTCLSIVKKSCLGIVTNLLLEIFTFKAKKNSDTIPGIEFLTLVSSPAYSLDLYFILLDWTDSGTIVGKMCLLLICIITGHELHNACLKRFWQPRWHRNSTPY